MGGNNDTLFALVGAGGYPYRAARRPLATQRDRFGSQLWRNGNIELQAAGNGYLIIFGTERDKTLAIFFILRGNQRNTLQQRAYEWAQFGVSGGWALGQACVGNHQRNMATMQSGNQVRPQLRFHNQHQFRVDFIEKTVEGIG